MSADDAPETGTTEDIGVVLNLESLDLAVAGIPWVLGHELEKLRRQVPYATEVQLTVRWRGQS